jgi:hypothetical protein
MALCPDCGLDHHPEPEPVVVDTGPNENSVEIAKIEADARIKAEKIYTEQERMRFDAEIVALRAENEALRNPVASTVTIETENETESEPEPVITEIEPEPEPPESPVTHEPKVSKKPGWWDAYS